MVLSEILCVCGTSRDSDGWHCSWHVSSAVLLIAMYIGTIMTDLWAKSVDRNLYPVEKIDR